MQPNRAAQIYTEGQHRSDWEVQLRLPTLSAAIDQDIIETAAEALFEFVFSGCDRLDGNRHWADCNEDTKTGFRGEAKAVLEAVWPMLLGQKPPRYLLRRA